MIETVWEMKVYFSAPSGSITKIKSAELNEIKIGTGFFKKEPYTLSNCGVGFMKRTKKEALATIVKQIKRHKNLADSIIALKQVILTEYPELLI